MKKLTAIFILALPLQLIAANLSLDPQYLNIKVYKFSVSESPLCTNPITIFEDSNPSYQDVLQNPTLGSGILSDGTYPCIIMEFSDNIKYAPNANSDAGNCTAGAEEILDVCRSGNSTMTDGSTTACDTNEQRVTMWLSTTSTSSGGDGFTPPTQLNDGANGFPLTNSLSISGTSSGKFVVNGTDQICDGDDGGCSYGGAGQCVMGPPAFSFEKI